MRSVLKFLGLYYGLETVNNLAVQVCLDTAECLHGSNEDVFNSCGYLDLSNKMNE